MGSSGLIRVSSPQSQERLETSQTSSEIITRVIMAGANETELREAFKLFDADGDGMISADELKTLITKVGGEMADAEAKALIHAADKDGNEGIDFEEFAQLWTTLHGAEEGKMRDEFAKLDTDKSGYITKDEMVTVISSEFQGDKMEEAKKAIDKLDVDKDGKVSYPEFILVMKYKK